MPIANELQDGIVKKELHVFYVLDVSGSMTGAPIAALNDAMRDTVRELADISSKSADASFKIAVMSYATDAKWITQGNGGMEDIEDFVWTDLEAFGVTYLGNALRELNDQLSRNAMMKSDTGNKVPVIIFMSDGFPNDITWKDELEKLQKNRWYQSAIKVAFALGDDANASILGEVVGTTEAVIKTSNLATFKKMIQVASVTASLTASVSHTSAESCTGSSVVRQALGSNQVQAQDGVAVVDELTDENTYTPADTETSIFDDSEIDLNTLDDFG